VCVPIKASKRRPRDEQDWQGNRLVSRHRVVAEHSIESMKRYHAVAVLFRNRKPKTDEHFNLPAAGLWNYFIN
jgi:hypothetical protein